MTPTHRTPAPLNTFCYGSPYYPEHWDEATRRTDPELFRGAGWNTIRMGEFGWDIMEPEEGLFDFSLFDETITRFAEVGIQTILCTPTAAPPRWLTARYPKVLRVDENGVPMQHGSRQHASHFSPVFRECSRRITRAMAEHFQGNPHVIGWQTDNEFHCHFSEDHSPAAQDAFRDFLKRRHGSIEQLNAAWGTAFWALTYTSFDQIETPRPMRPTHTNPAQILDYARFLSDGVTAFQYEQVEILRATNPRWWVSHNGCFKFIDYASAFGEQLDFLGYDVYPSFDRDTANRRFSHAFNLDYVRSYRGNFFIFEHQSGPGGQADYLLDTPEPGEMRRMVWTSIARGADGMLLFRERTCRFGAEEYWCGVIDHDNVPRRRYHEAAQIGRELERIGPQLLGTSVEVQVGIAGGNFDALYGHRPITLGLPNPRNVAESLHQVFESAGHAAGIVRPDDSLDGLAVYIIPHFAVFDPAWVPTLEAWVRAGGTLVIGARTGSKDLNNNVVSDTLPGALRDLVGATVEEYGRQNHPEARPLHMEFADNAAERFTSELWYEALQPDEETEVVATWSGRHLDGQPAITRRRVGSGNVFYVGTYFTKPAARATEALLRALGVLATPECVVTGVERVVRDGDGRRFTFLINHTDTPVDVPASGTDLISEQRVDGTITLAPNGVSVIAS